MKKNSVILSLIAGMFFMTAFNPIKDDIYTVDVERSTIEWSAKKVGGGHAGTVKIADGTLIYTGKALKSGNFQMNMSSITSDNARVTTHLKSDDFFSTEKNPMSKFEITKVTPAGTDRVNITGNLTIKGFTHPVTFPATVRTAVFRPQAMARAITKSTLGPGAKMMTMAATMYSASRVGMIMWAV